MPLITVITAVKNAATFLPETIASIRAQTVDDWRYIIVDDASDDDTAEVAEAAASIDRRIEVFCLQSSVGPYAAANLAAQQVDSKYIARIDGDDVAEPRRFAVQIETLEKTVSAKGCASAWRPLTDSGVGDVRLVPSQRNGVIKWMMWFRSNLVHSTLMIDTAFFRDIGGYGPGRIGEDFRMWSALVREGALAVAPDPLVRYRFTPGQMTGTAEARDNPERAQITLDHMRLCAPNRWTFEDARDFRRIGERSAFGPGRALELLQKFETAWRSDGTLDAFERHELARHTARRRLRHLRRALSDSKRSVVSASVRNSRAVLSSGMELLTNRGPAWP